MNIILEDRRKEIIALVKSLFHWEENLKKCVKGENFNIFSTTCPLCQMHTKYGLIVCGKCVLTQYSNRCSAGIWSQVYDSCEKFINMQHDVEIPPDENREHIMKKIQQMIDLLEQILYNELTALYNMGFEDGIKWANSERNPTPSIYDLD